MDKIQMLTIPHIEPIGLIAQDGADLSKVFCNHYLVQATNDIADQDQVQALHFRNSQFSHPASQKGSLAVFAKYENSAVTLPPLADSVRPP